MSDNQTPAAVRRGLLTTDDAMVWAQEFCRIYTGKTICNDSQHEANELTPDIMVGWFANAMETALDIKARREEIETDQAPLGMVPEAQREAFVEGFEDGRETRPTDLDDPSA